MEMKNPPPCPKTPNTMTVRRNPPRKARPTPSSVPLQLPFSSSSISKNLPSFPIQDILSIELPPNPNPDLPISSPISEDLKVFLRIRPLTPHQNSAKHTKIGPNYSRSKIAWPQNPSAKTTSKTNVKKKSEICLRVNDSHSVTLCPPQSLQDLKRIKSEVYEGFSHVFSADSSQEEVYEKMVNPLVEDFMRGKSGMLAALGPSGSGKTHTVFGCPREPGMVTLALRRIFSQTKGSETESLRTFYLSMFEICSERGKSERIFDLSPDGGDLCMQQSTIKGLQEAIIYDAQQAESLIANGLIKRATAMTNSNNQSSRSQCIINIHSGPNKIDGEVGAQSQSALLTIVDLAGAEREKRTGNQGARLLESNFINNTSMVFGLCLRSLLEHQKNRKKPLQKHFQSSMLTRYLRDYLEGKKRMALILTLKSGEGDYLDASFLLRQASPYMKIKFSNVEEPLNVIGNKRHFQTLPRAEQLKRMKFSSSEAGVVDDGKGDGDYQFHKEIAPEQIKEDKPTRVLVQSPIIIDSEVNGNMSLEKDATKLAKRNRENQIMQDFAKALWNVLKQYKKKVEVTENEIHCLRESLNIEKALSCKLENEWNDLKSRCSCGKEVSAEVSLVEVDESKADGFSELDGNQSTDADDSLVEVDESRADGFLELDGHQSTDLKSRGSCGKEVSPEVSLVEVDESRADGISELDGYQSTDADEVMAGVSFSNLKGSDCMDDKKSSNATVRSSGVVTASCLGDENFEEQSDQVRSSGVVTASCFGDENFEEQSDQKGDNSPGNVDNAEELKDHKDIGREDTCQTTGFGLSESVISSSQPLIIVRDDRSSSVEVDRLQNEAARKLLDQPVLPREDSLICDVSNALEIEPKLVSCCKPLNPEKPKRRLLPASSILKNINGLDFQDENEKLKGTRGEKKVAIDETKRTRGSICLLRLLRDNLHL